nr:unnamed protein product [Spirometra erinaceieuropaei]
MKRFCEKPRSTEVKGPKLASSSTLSQSSNHRYSPVFTRWLLLASGSPYSVPLIVRLGNQLSAEVTVTGGAPQDSALDPVLFLIYTDDCVRGLDFDITMFADYIKLSNVIGNEDDGAYLQANLNRLKQWSGHWLQPFTVTRCNILRIGRTSSAHHRQCPSSPLSVTSSDKVNIKLDTVAVLATVPKLDKLTILEDLNARVGTEYAVCLYSVNNIAATAADGICSRPGSPADSAEAEAERRSSVCGCAT